MELFFKKKEQGGEWRETKINANTNEANPPEEPASPQDPTVGKGIKEENWLKEGVSLPHTQRRRTALVFADALRTGYIDSQRIIRESMERERELTILALQKEKEKEGLLKGKEDASIKQSRWLIQRNVKKGKDPKRNWNLRDKGRATQEKQEKKEKERD